jgi:hypothetical protein
MARPDAIDAIGDGMPQQVAALVASAAARLGAADARTELRVAYTGARGLRGAALHPRERVWRLGALLIAADRAADRGAAPALFATGQVHVVAEPAHPNFRSNAALERHELNRLADRARIPVGETIVVGASPLDPAAGLGEPLVHLPGGVGIRWAPGAAPVPLAGYLDERVGLLVDPPEGA